MDIVSKIWSVIQLNIIIVVTSYTYFIVKACKVLAAVWIDFLI